MQEEPFEYSAFPGRFATPVVGASLAIILVASSASALIGKEQFGLAILFAGLVAVAIFVRHMLGDGVLDVTWMRRQGVNLVATRGSSAPKVWLVAHLDSKSQPVPSAVRVAGVAVLAGMVLVAVVAALLTLAGGAPRVLSWIIIVGSAVGGIPVMMSVVGNRSDGAADNASGVAAVLGAAALMRPDLESGVLLPSAEELGLAGARAFVRKRPKGVALNCDGVDDTGTLVVMHNGAPPLHVIAALREEATREAAPPRVRRMPLGLLTDSTAFHDGGWESVTVSHGSLATLRRVHTGHDSLENLRGSSIDLLARVIAGAADALANQAIPHRP